MTSNQLEQAINSLCISSQFETLYRIIKDIPGCKAVLVSDRPAEQKRQELLELLKQKNSAARTAKSLDPANQNDW